MDGIAEAIEALAKAEKLIGEVDRTGIVAKLDELREFVEDLSRMQLDLRIARLRLQAMGAPHHPTVSEGSTAGFRKVASEK